MARAPPSPPDRARQFKRVRFYLFRYRSGHTREHDDEVEQAAWMSADEALRRLSYENERKIFLKAQRYLKNRTGFHLEQKAGA